METDLGQCHHNGWGRYDCSHHEDAGIYCAAQAMELFNETLHNTTNVNNTSSITFAIPHRRNKRQQRYMYTTTYQSVPLTHCNGHGNASCSCNIGFYGRHCEYQSGLFNAAHLALCICHKCHPFQHTLAVTSAMELAHAALSTIRQRCETSTYQ